MSYIPHLRCRACNYGPPFDPGGIKNSPGKDHLESVLNLGVLPLPNAFRKTGEMRPGHYPVELLVCPNCHLGQLSAVVDPRVMYDTYPYVTSNSRTMSEHFDRLWSDLNRERKIESVVEIGSNDGLCLEHFRKLGATSVLGIDPAQNLADEAKKRGVNTIRSLFDRQTAEMASASMPPIDLVLARHVFCHVDDWQEFINNIAVLCHKETTVCIEVPYAQDMIERCEWDTIYAEHLSYLTIKSVQHLLHGSALRIHRIDRYPIHGGAIGLVLRRRDSQSENDPTLLDYIAKEKCGLSYWHNFANQARDQIAALKFLVKDLRSQGKRVVGYGASAKSTMWINAMGFTRQEIEAVYDNTPQKWYTTIPGTDIPVVHEGAFFADCADYAVLWAWNFSDEIFAKQAKWHDQGGKWIVPVPTVQTL